MCFVCLREKIVHAVVPRPVLLPPHIPKICHKKLIRLFINWEMVWIFFLLFVASWNCFFLLIRAMSTGKQAHTVVCHIETTPPPLYKLIQIWKMEKSCLTTLGLTIFFDEINFRVIKMAYPPTVAHTRTN